MTRYMILYEDYYGDEVGSPEDNLIEAIRFAWRSKGMVIDRITGDKVYDSKEERSMYYIVVWDENNLPQIVGKAPTRLAAIEAAKTWGDLAEIWAKDGHLVTTMAHYYDWYNATVEQMGEDIARMEAAYDDGGY